MPDLPSLSRPLFQPSGGVAVVSFLVCGVDAARVADVPVAAAQAAGALPTGVSVYARDGATGPHAEWLQGLFDATKPPGASGLAAAPVWIEIGGDTPDAPHHRSLSEVWAAVRALVTALAPVGAVWDGLAMAWRSADEVLAAAPGDLRLPAVWRCETIDGFGDAAGGAWVCVHTLGLAKFARRDLVAFGAAANRALLVHLVSALGDDLVAGAVLREGDVIAKGGLTVAVEGYRPGENAPALDVPCFVPPLVLIPGA